MKKLQVQLMLLWSVTSFINKGHTEFHLEASENIDVIFLLAKLIDLLKGLWTQVEDR